jgi:hypothetical protein
VARLGPGFESLAVINVSLSFFGGLLRARILVQLRYVHRFSQVSLTDHMPLVSHFGKSTRDQVKIFMIMFITLHGVL